MRTKIIASATSGLKTSIAVLVLVSLLSCAAAASRTITGINVANRSDRVIITVKGSGPLKMAALKSARGSYLGFQFSGTLSTKGRLVGIRSGRIYNVRYSSFSSNPPAVRIVLNTAGFVDYCTDWSPKRDRVDLTIWKFGVNLPRTTATVAKQQPVTKVLGVVQEQGKSLDMVPAADALSTEPAPVIAASPAPRVPAKAEMMASAALCRAEQPKIALLPDRPTQVSTAKETRVSLNFLGADINDVLKALSVQSGRNIVSSKEVSGNVTVSLSDVSVDEALDYVAKLSGYGYTKNNDTYLVGSKAGLLALNGGGDVASDDTRKVDVIQVHYIPLKKISDIIRNSMPEIKLPEDKKDDKNEDQPGGFLLVVGPSGMVAEARRIAEEMDEATKELMGSQKTAVYRVKYVSPYDLALTLQRLVPGINVGPAPQDGFELAGPEAVKTGDNGSQVTGSTNATASTTSNTDSSEKSEDKGPLFIPGRTQSVMIVGPEDQVQKALELAATLDVKSPQIKIEAKVTSLTKDGEKKLGIDWNWSELGIQEGFSDYEKATQLKPPFSGENQENVEVAHNRWFRLPINVGATLDALITSGDGQLLAAPSLLCLEGKPGVFFVGDEVTYIQRIEQTDNGQNIKTDTRQVGVQLRVVGDVADSNYITLNLHPEVSVLRLVADQAGITLPIITRRFTDHVVRVKSGETLVIGGLIRDEEIDEINRVPLLSDLPFFGKLFKHRDKTSNHSEVVMFITATIVND